LKSVPSIQLGQPANWCQFLSMLGLMRLSDLGFALKAFMVMAWSTSTPAGGPAVFLVF
jgi:hypothetical protein